MSAVKRANNADKKGGFFEIHSIILSYIKSFTMIQYQFLVFFSLKGESSYFSQKIWCRKMHFGRKNCNQLYCIKLAFLCTKLVFDVPNLYKLKNCILYMKYLANFSNIIFVDFIVFFNRGISSFPFLEYLLGPCVEGDSIKNL